MRPHRLLYYERRGAVRSTRRRQHFCNTGRCPRRIVRLVQGTLVRTRTSLSWRRRTSSTTSRNFSSCEWRRRPRQLRQGVSSASAYDLSSFDNPAADSCIRFIRGVLDPPWGAIPLPNRRTRVSAHLASSDGSNKSSMLSPAVLRRRLGRRGVVHPQQPTT